MSVDDDWLLRFLAEFAAMSESERDAALGAALGSDVRVRASGTGFKVELAFASADEAVALARRLRPRAVA